MVSVVPYVLSHTFVHTISTVLFSTLLVSFVLITYPLTTSHSPLTVPREEHLQVPNFLPVLRIVERAYSQVYKKGSISSSGEMVPP